MDITLYHQPGTRSQRVRWMLEELGLEYQLKYINLFKGDGNTEHYRSIHPLGLLPALEFDNNVMLESGAIVQWLAETHLARGFAPALDSPNRHEFDQWMYFAVSTLEGPAWDIVLHRDILPDKIAVKAIIPFCEKQLVKIFDILDQAIHGKDYLVGGQFSAADIMVGYILMWFPDQLVRLPSLQAYVTRLSQRAAYQRSIVD